VLTTHFIFCIFCDQNNLPKQSTYLYTLLCNYFWLTPALLRLCVSHQLVQLWFSCVWQHNPFYYVVHFYSSYIGSYSPLYCRFLFFTRRES
jgi:hypothetical protein